MQNGTLIHQEIYQALQSLPTDSLKEVWQFIEFMRFKKSEVAEARLVKLGGLLANYNVDFSEDDISQARNEVWHNLGEINE